jgi:hypothetical protein
MHGVSPGRALVVWDEVCQWRNAEGERTGRCVFDELQQRYPRQFTDGQTRTQEMS